MNNTFGKVESIIEIRYMADTEDDNENWEKGLCVEKIIYKFDVNKIIIKQDNYFKSRDKLKLESSRYFNKMGHVDHVLYFDSTDGSIKNKYINNNNDEGVSPHSIFTEKDGKVLYNIYSKYDILGRQIEWKSYSVNEELVSWHLKNYDNFGNEIGDIQNSPNGEIIAVTLNVYGENNNLIESKIQNIFGEAIQKYQYDNLDSFGNWQLKLTVEKGKVVFITERALFYFPEII